MADWLTRAWRAPWLWMALVVALFCVPLFQGLDRRDLDNDEAIYSFSVDVMLKSGDWLTPRLIPSETFPFLEKPPLKFWIVGLPIRWGLLPQNEFGMRFWDAVMGSLAFLYVFAIGRRIAGPLCGLAAVFLLFTHGPLVLDHGLRTNNMEAAIFLAYAAGMYHFLAWRSSGPDARGHIIAMAMYFVLGFMTKFVAALFLPVVLVMASLLKREERVRVFFQWRSFAIAGGLAIALIAPWFVYEYSVFGPRLYNTIVGDQVVKRLTAYIDPTHVQPWHFYFTHLWSVLRGSGAAPVVVLGAMLILWRTIRQRWLEGALLVLWFVVPMTVISTGTSKLYHYAYPFLPPLALAGGYAVSSVADWIARLARRVTQGRAPAARAALAIAPALALGLLPIAPYRATLQEIGRDAHPLRDLRACLSPIAARATADGFGTPGVWVEGSGFSHRPTYYLYNLGPWQQREMASDATVAMHLFAPNDYHPVLLSARRFDDFTTHLGRDADDVIRAAARHTDLAPETLLEYFRGSTVGLVSLGDAALLLPGPYSSCAADHFKTASP
jgi:4-amino-4-deoxy-L-arabinose transferase-like glycosyltransferase